jgi:hypothetical protein
MMPGHVLLAPDEVTLHPPGADDRHGWAEAGDGQLWAGLGNLQLAPGPSDPRAAAGGGHGPYAPAFAASGTLYLPPEAPATDGTWARVRGAAYVLSQVREVADPYDGNLTCLVAAVSSPPAGGGG